MKKHFYKTIAMIMVCMTLSTSLFASTGFVSDASSVILPSGISAETSAEMLLNLYLLLESGMIVSGAKEGLDEAESAENLKDAFFSFVDSLSDSLIGSPLSWQQDFTFVTSDGQTVTLDSETYKLYLDDGSTLEVSNSQFWNAMLTGTITADPDDTDTDETEDAFLDNWNALRDAYLHEKFEVYLEQYKQGSGGGSGDDPDDHKGNLFTKIAKVTVGAGFLGVVGNFITDLINGETELNVATYYTGVDYMYTGKVPQDANGYYLYRGTLGPSLSNGLGLYYINETTSNIFVGFIADGYLRFGYVNDTRVATFNCLRPSFNSSASSSGVSLREDSWQNLNFPIFPSEAEAINYYLTGDASAAVNAPAYDFPDMAESVPETLHPVTGISFSPNSVIDLNTSLKTAADGYIDGGSSNVATNTEEYKNNLFAVIEKHANDNMSETEPDVEPEPIPDPEPGINYFDILNKILIALISLADSVWNLFREPLEEFQKSFNKIYNGILRIIEIIPHQMELVRGNIVTLPQSIFDLFTSPLAAIQEVLGVGVNAQTGLWSSLEPYLQDFKKLLSAMVPETSLGIGGTTDIPGTDTTDTPVGGFKFKIILDGLILIILILIILLKIFLHCLEFIINVFQIPATPGFLPDDMVIGFNYIKSLEIPGIGMSVFDFMMGLVYILLVFGVIRGLRKNINHIRIER